jgi:diguanylate cyclase (GGDEF)-like protein
VALYDPTSSLVTIPLYYEHGEYQVGLSRDIQENPGLIGSVIKARRTVYLHDNIKQVTRPLVRPDGNAKVSSKSYIGIPLTVRDRVIGVMAVQSHHPNAYSEDQVRLLERIAIQAAIAIDNARLYAEEQRLAIIDELTGVYNYRGLLVLGEREVERARRFKRPLAALFFDIDDFRKFNNTYSHTTGNLVLQAIIRRCRKVLRSVDILTRFGGDEFVVLLPETDLPDAEAIAGRLAEEIASTRVKTPFGDLKVTASIGVAVLAPNMQDLSALLDRANQAEHQAKRS